MIRALLNRLRRQPSAFDAKLAEFDRRIAQARAPVTTRSINFPVLLGRHCSRECISTSTCNALSTGPSPAHTHQRGGS
jgi:hypothetical protein